MNVIIIWKDCTTSKLYRKRTETNKKKHLFEPVKSKKISRDGFTLNYGQQREILIRGWQDKRTINIFIKLFCKFRSYISQLVWRNGRNVIGCIPNKLQERKWSNKRIFCQSWQRQPVNEPFYYLLFLHEIRIKSTIGRQCVLFVCLPDQVSGEPSSPRCHRLVRHVIDW